MAIKESRLGPTLTLFFDLRVKKSSCAGLGFDLLLNKYIFFQTFGQEPNYGLMKGKNKKTSYGSWFFEILAYI